uniref:tetratricopeptide repeat protein n=1 Tax=Candidatus Electronema sp. TaxID=2698783 RepID=UPI0040563E4A
MTSVIQNIVSLLSPTAADSLSFLAVPRYLNDELATGILVKSGLANGNAPDVVEEIRSFPIWHKKNRTSWSIDDDVREYVLSKLNGSAESTRRRVLNALREIRRQPEALSPAFNLRRFDLQLARLSLTVEQEQQSGIAVLRQFFNLHHDETSRVVDLYIDESLPAEVPSGTLPDHLHSAYFMRGHYAYKNRQFKAALRFLEPVWKRRGGSAQSRHDAAIAAHLVGLMWSKETRRHHEAENAYRESLELGKEDSHHQAQVLHSLGNLLSKNRQRDKEAEEAYRKSLVLLERIGDQFGQAQVWHSLGNLLSKNRQRDKEAEDAYRKSLLLAQDNAYHQAQVWHSLGNLLSKNRQRGKEAEDAYRKSLLLRGADDQFGQAQVLHSLGNLLGKNRQRDKEAEDAYRKSLLLLERIGDQFGQAQVLHSLGNLLSKNRQRDKEAEDAYRKSLLLGKDNPHHQAELQHSWANFLSKNKSCWPEAEELYKKSLDAAKNNPRHKVMVARSYGLLLIEKGDYDQAEKYLRIALENERNDFYRDTIAAKLEEVARKKAGR